jgi:hypothetical protein
MLHASDTGARWEWDVEQDIYSDDDDDDTRQRSSSVAMDGTVVWHEVICCTWAGL